MAHEAVVLLAGPPIMKDCRRGETLVAAQKAVGAHPTSLEAGAPPGRDDGEMAYPVAGQEVDQAPPIVVKAGAPSGQEDEEMAAAQGAGKAPTNGGGGWGASRMRG
jgi:hypothetical protein